MTWKRNITFEEVDELYQYRMTIRDIWIGREEGWEYHVCHMGCDPLSFHKSPRAAYNSAIKYIKKHNLKRHLTTRVADGFCSCSPDTLVNIITGLCASCSKTRR